MNTKVASLTKAVFKTACILAAVALMGAVAEACPTCKDSLNGDPAQANLIRGYFWSIVFMMSMPFLILGSFSAYLYYEVRKARAAAEKQASSAASSPLESR